MAVTLVVYLHRCSTNCKHIILMAKSSRVHFVGCARGALGHKSTKTTRARVQRRRDCDGKLTSLGVCGYSLELQSTTHSLVSRAKGPQGAAIEYRSPQQSFDKLRSCTECAIGSIPSGCVHHGHIYSDTQLIRMNAIYCLETSQ